MMGDWFDPPPISFFYCIILFLTMSLYCMICILKYSERNLFKKEKEKEVFGKKLIQKKKKKCSERKKNVYLRIRRLRLILNKEIFIKEYLLFSRLSIFNISILK